jgi:nicotinamidase-related amidase
VNSRTPSRHGREGGDAGASALLVIDMLNTYEHADSDPLAESAADAVPSIAALEEKAGEAEVPVIYVNDSYGDWNTSSQELAEKAMAGAHPELVEPILPPEEAAFVVKARHSVFYGTPLEYLLDQEGISRLVLTGQVTEQCILYSALDGYVRHFDVAVPRDAVAHIHRDLADAALDMMERNMSAEIVSAADFSFGSG